MAITSDSPRGAAGDKGKKNEKDKRVLEEHNEP
jgi:hypothetical protein